MNNSSPEKIQEVLHTKLGKLEKFEQCALLDYPDNFNVGDHLIWLASVFYLTDIAKTKINYIAASTNFSDSAMEKQVGKAPIFLNGGGNLSDTWLVHQTFREEIISKYRDRPIIILPQSIYFTSQSNLEKTAKIFNSHPNLTLFTRDTYSYELALKYFYNCEVILSPDMVFHMAGMPELSFRRNPNLPILYHCRQDKELNKNSSPTSINLPNLIVEDWRSFKWMLGDPKASPVPVILRRLIRKVWQRGLATPQEWVSRQKWHSLHPYAAKFNGLYNSSLHRTSWSFMHSGVYQLKQYRLVITNRLHGHILSTLLGIPHIFLPNSYHKNEFFYETWTSEIPFCRFIKDASQIEANARELLELLPG